MDLNKWIGLVKEKRSQLGEKATGLEYSIPTELKHSELTLTEDNTPYLVIEPGLTSEAFASEGTAAGERPLLGAIANIVEKLGDTIFSSPKAFQEGLKRLESDINRPFSRTIDFMRKVEARLQGTEPKSESGNDPLNNYPLYIWYAFANYNRAETEQAVFPMLGSEETGEDTPSTEGSPE